MRYSSWLLISFTILVGCSDANNKADVPLSDDPFAIPDPTGSSYVAQLGYSEVRDTSRYLATAEYMGIYFDIHTQVGALIREATSTAAITPYPCPQGGSVNTTVTNPGKPIAVFNAMFTDCGVDDRLLSGSITRTGMPIVFGFGNGRSITTTFDALSITADAKGSLTVTGSATRTSTVRYSEAGVVDRGECVLAENDFTYVTELDIASANLELASIAGTVTVTDSTFERRSGRSYDVTSDEAICPLSRRLIESGETSASFSGYGPTAIEGAAVISTSVNLDDDNNSRMGTQSTTLSDESSVVISVLAEGEDRVQVDILSDGTAMSFEDTYRFTAADFDLEYF